MAVAQFLAAIVSFFATSTPLGKVGLADIGKALFMYLVHSGAALAILSAIGTDATHIGNPVLAAFAVSLVKLATDLVKQYASGPSK